MGKRSISIKGILQDMKEGMDEQSILTKYDLTSQQLEKALDIAVQKGVLSTGQLARLRERGAKAPAAADTRAATVEPPSHEHGKQGSRKQAARPPARGKRLPVVKIYIGLWILAIIAFGILTPWWATVAVVIAGAAGLVLVLKLAVERFFMGAFEAKGAALAGADVQVHRISPAELPPQDEDEEEDQDYSQFRWHYLDVTIKPDATSAGFTHWEPGELMLVGLDAKPEEFDDGAEEVAILHDYKIYANNAFVEDEVFKHAGPQRIQLHVGVKPGVDKLQFRYYFELFGNVAFPPRSS